MQYTIIATTDTKRINDFIHIALYLMYKSSFLFNLMLYKTDASVLKGSLCSA